MHENYFFLKRAIKEISFLKNDITPKIEEIVPMKVQKSIM